MYYRVLLLIIFIAFPINYLKSKQKNNFTVIIDPGHGGKDPGSVHYGVYEKNLALDMSIKLYKILKSKKINVCLTRNTDLTLSLENRVKISNSKLNTIFVSIHFNANEDRRVSGIETLYFSSNKKSKRLASYIQKSMSKRLSNKDLGIRHDNRLYILRNVKGASVIVECGFLSNYIDNRRCTIEWYRKLMAEDLSKGIINYLNIK